MHEKYVNSHQKAEIQNNQLVDNPLQEEQKSTDQLTIDAFPSVDYHEKAEKEKVIFEKSACDALWFGGNGLAERFTSIRPALETYGYKFTRNPQDVEDSLQETEYIAYANGPGIKNLENFSTWCHRVLMRQIGGKQTKVKTMNFSGIEADIENFETGNVITLIGDSPPDDPEALVIQHEAYSLVHSVLGSLDAKYKIVLELYYFQEYSYENIAEELAVSINTVKTRIRRARQMLRPYLEAYGYEK